MNNGFEIKISEKEFKEKPEKDQNWLLFQGLIHIGETVSSINAVGCEYGRKRRTKTMIETLSAISGSIAFALGMVYIVYQLTCK